MAPERPLGADAMQTAVEAQGAFRETDPSAPPGLGSKGLYAAVDLGTNACRMLIAQPRGSQFVVVDSFSKTVQLGAGLEASGRLGRASMGGPCRLCASARKRSNSTASRGCALWRRKPVGVRAILRNSCGRCGVKQG